MMEYMDLIIFIALIILAVAFPWLSKTAIAQKYKDELITIMTNIENQFIEKIGTERLQLAVAEFVSKHKALSWIPNSIITMAVQWVFDKNKDNIESWKKQV